MTDSASPSRSVTTVISGNEVVAGMYGLCSGWSAMSRASYTRPAGRPGDPGATGPLIQASAGPGCSRAIPPRCGWQAPCSTASLMSEHQLQQRDEVEPAAAPGGAWADAFGRAGEVTQFAQARREQLQRQALLAFASQMEGGLSGMEGAGSPAERFAMLMHGMQRGSAASRNLGALANQVSLDGAMHSMEMMTMAFGADSSEGA